MHPPEFFWLGRQISLSLKAFLPLTPTRARDSMKNLKLRLGEGSPVPDDHG